MKLEYFFYKTALYIAIEKNDLEMVQLLLANNNIDVNYLSIFKI